MSSANPTQSMQFFLYKLQKVIAVAILTTVGSGIAANQLQAEDSSGASVYASRPLPALPQTQQQLIPNSQFIDNRYLLGPGDILSVTVFNVPEYSGEQRVLANGSINLPVVGPVFVSGMTLESAEVAIANKFQAELRYPDVTLNLLQPRSLRIAVTGEILSPGYYNLPVTDEGQFPSLVEAIQEAGGMTQAANPQQVIIERIMPGQAGTQRFSTNLAALINEGDLSQDVQLRDGDSITLLAATDLNIATSSQIAASNLAIDEEEPVTVAVIGEVTRPGTYNYASRRTSGQSNEQTVANTLQQPGRLTLTRALRLAGGIEPLADLRRVEVRRSTRQGESQLITLNLWEIVEEGSLSQDIVLQDGDTIVVPTATAATAEEISQLTGTNLAPDTIQVNVVGEVDAPGPVSITANTTLNQALLAAGGFNQRARQQVELIRLNPNGTVTQRSIDINLAQSLDSETNPIVRNNDIVVVRPTGAAGFADSIGTLLSPFLEILPINFNGWNGLNL